MNKALPYLKVFLFAVLAGLSIGLGGFLYLLITWGLPNELGKALGSAAFSVGLFLVCTFGLWLYTGKIGNVFEGKQKASFYISLPICLIGNAVGAIGLGYLCFAIFRQTDLLAVAINAASGRLALNNFYDYLSFCLRSTLCGFCVYMAVKLFARNRLKPLGISMLVFFVFLFVYCGFQHCIANMFYLAFANTYGNGMAYVSLLLAILFNSFGPILGIAVFRLIETKKAE